MISTNKGLYTRPVRRDDVRRVFTTPEHSVGPARTEPTDHVQRRGVFISETVQEKAMVTTERVIGVKLHGLQ